MHEHTSPRELRLIAIQGLVLIGAAVLLFMLVAFVIAKVT